jgi:aspartate aminotransferase
MFSNPPIHGARIVAEILEDKGLTDIWRGEVKGMADRIITMSTVPSHILANLTGDTLRNHLEKDFKSSVLIHKSAHYTNFSCRGPT